MPISNNILAGSGQGSSGDLGDTIEQSLRFRAVDKTFLEKTWADNGNHQTWTFSTWFKKAPHGTNYRIWTEGPTNANSFTSLMLDGDCRIRFYTYSGGNVYHDYVSNAEFRDYSAWYHLVVAYDTNAGASTNRIKIYVNGDRLTSFSSLNVPTAGFNSMVGSAGMNAYIGTYVGGASNPNTDNFINGYLAETIFIDGSQLDPTEFGRVNDDGVWVPKSYTGNYTGHSWRMQYKNSAGLGNDSSGLNNHFTAQNFVQTAISTNNFDNDIDYLDTPTSNYATLQPQVLKGIGTDIDANLAVRSNSGGHWDGSRFSTEAVDTGKWYCEVEELQGEAYIGIADYTYWARLNTWSNVVLGSAGSNSRGYYTYSGQKRLNGSFSSYGSASGGNAHTYMVAWNGDTGTIWIGRNGVWENSATAADIANGVTANSMYTGLTGRDWRIGVQSAYTDVTKRIKINFGQRPFQYTPPTGFKALQSNNKPEPTIKKGNQHFGVLKYSAPGSPSYPVTINGIGGGSAGEGELDFGDKPDLVWIKMTNGAQNHTIFDSLRGNTKSLRSDENIAEANRTNFDFVNNGIKFTGADAETYQQNDTYMAWCWKAGGAPTATNSANAGAAQTAGSVKVDGANGSFAQGTIKVNKMSVNTTAGFSIVQYTGTGSAGTIPHGLGAVPEMGIFKRIDGTSSWDVYHRDLDGDATRNILLDQGSSQTAENSTYWNNTLPTSTLFSLGAGGNNNSLNEECIAYIWKEIEGFSKFGSYRGTGSSGNDGAFVYTGFRPRFLMVRVFNTSGAWMMWDTQRNPFNPIQNRVVANLANAEGSFATQELDILANGFKLRGADSDVNETYHYIYMAWAENPFGGENVPPANGR